MATSKPRRCRVFVVHGQQRMPGKGLAMENCRVLCMVSEKGVRRQPPWRLVTTAFREVGDDGEARHRRRGFVGDGIVSDHEKMLHQRCLLAERGLAMHRITNPGRL